MNWVELNEAKVRTMKMAVKKYRAIARAKEKVKKLEAEYKEALKAEADALRTMMEAPIFAEDMPEDEEVRLS